MECLVYVSAATFHCKLKQTEQYFRLHHHREIVLDREWRAATRHSLRLRIWVECRGHILHLPRWDNQRILNVEIK